MELIDQHTKKIMEGCKERARDAGLKFQDETLEYIVTNRDLLELSPKIMIPTLYDYWVHDVEVLKEKGKYELYPGNPYETVINTRPAISFYNDNNPDWLNVMIFYHVLAHIDFFQNNIFYRHTWDYDFTGQALSDKRLIAKLRSEHGRWVDYVIEFSRGIDNLAGYYYELSGLNSKENAGWSKRIDFYFDVFIQEINKLSVHEYIKEIERYNECMKESGDLGEDTFMAEIDLKHPEFKELFRKSREEKPKSKPDLIQYLMEHSEFLNKEKNKWMNSVLQVVRNTSIFFQPQIRTKIMNEGWASYWHETLFMKDDRIGGHEVDFARLNAGVTSMPRVGLNPYALGMRLFYYIEEMADKGMLSFEFQKVANAEERKIFDRDTKNGRSFIFSVRENYSDFMFINKFLDQDFATRNRLFVAGRRLNRAKKVYEYYIKSRKLEDYRGMVLDSLYHPPQIEIDTEKMKDNSLYLTHTFENKPLVKEFISNTMVGIEYLWGAPVHLETHEVVGARSVPSQDLTLLGPTPTGDETAAPEIKWQKVLYSMKNKKLTRKIL
ncbi:MAG: SpoVR family protein [Deltaproteobacteria bacterium]|nr:SpoVR family protein [Deltaproteobacteria bacterium]